MNDDNMGDNSEITVVYDEMNNILANLTECKKVVNEANGQLRSKIKASLEDQGWHKGALAMVRSIDDMSATGRADFLRSFEPMFDAMIENKWRDEQTDMFGEGSDQE